MNLIWILLFVLLVIALVGAPGWGPWQHGYGWYPSGGLSLVFVILLILLLLGRI